MNANATTARRPVQVGLADLIAWTLGAALVAALGRQVKPATWFTAPFVELGQPFGLWAASVAVFLGIALCRQAVLLMRARRAGGPPVGAAVVWRLAVTALLVLAYAAEVFVLGRQVPARLVYDPESVRTGLLPIAITVALAGVVAGLTPGRSSPRRWGWPSVILAAIAAVVISASEMVITYIVMISLQAVRNATRYPSVALLSRPGLNDRLISAGIEGLPALVSCVLLGICVSQALRRPAPQPGEDEDESSRRVLVLLILAAITALAGAWLVLVTLLRLDEWLAESLLTMLGPFESAAILLALASLALGLSARAADRPAPPDAADAPCRWPAGLIFALKTGLVLVLLDVILARVLVMAGFHDWRWLRWVGWTEAAISELTSLMPRRLHQVWTLLWLPENLIIVAGLAWLSWRVLLLLLAPIDPGTLPIDATLGDRRARIRLLVRSAALVVLMTASLPVLFIQGLVALHLALHAL